MRLPRRYAPFVYGVIQAALTTGLATAIATFSAGGDSMEMMMHWLSSWGLSWLSTLPVVILIAPLIQRAVISLIKPEELTPSERQMRPR
ncbi:MAG: DUF2798 domain-containing protein [Hyphomicrobiaceae bacterium]